MDIEKNVKFSIFAILALMPIMLGFLFFDYSNLSDYSIIREFGKTSLIMIAIIYTGIAISFRIAIFYLLEYMKDKTIQEFVAETKFIEVFYIGCFDVFFYGAIPILITFLLHGNIIHFFGNSLIVWFCSLAIFFIWVQIFKNKNIFDKYKH